MTQTIDLIHTAKHTAAHTTTNLPEQKTNTQTKKTKVGDDPGGEGAGRASGVAPRPHPAAVRRGPDALRCRHPRPDCGPATARGADRLDHRGPGRRLPGHRPGPARGPVERGGLEHLE